MSHTCPALEGREMLCQPCAAIQNVVPHWLTALVPSQVVRFEYGQEFEVQDIGDYEQHDADAVDEHHAPAHQLLPGTTGVTLEVCGDEVHINMALKPQYTPGAHLLYDECSLNAHGAPQSQAYEVMQNEQQDACPQLRFTWACRLSIASRCYAGGELLAWAGIGTRLPQGFTSLRLETNDLFCSAKERLPHAVPEAELENRAGNPVQLLCRALRMAPGCYSRFELAAQYRTLPLTLSGAVSVKSEDGQGWRGDGGAQFDTVTELAAAMQQVAEMENLLVHLLPDEQTIAVSRSRNEVPGGAADM